MIIQCPECSARYRIKNMAPGRSEARLECSKCQCRFTLTAPRVAGESPTLRRGASVLMVDDAHFFREMLADLLQPLHLNLQLATNAAEALEWLRKKSFVLMLLDLNLPDKNGLELIQEIRGDEQLKETRILAMSGVYRREDDAMAAIRAGADSFINKSFRPEELRDKVKKFLST